MREDIEKLRLETENLQLKCALEFYAEGRHLWHADKRDSTTHKEYDSVSGVVENGAYAFEKLREIEDELPGKTGKLESENKRLREALEEIKNNVKEAQDPVYSFHFDLDSKHGMFILETAENALKEIEK